MSDLGRPRRSSNSTEPKHQIGATTNVASSKKKRNSRVKMLKRVQGVDIRITLGQLIAVNNLLSKTESHLDIVKKELHSLITQTECTENGNYSDIFS